MNVDEAVNQKRAIRQFSDRPIPDEILVRILNAGRRSGGLRTTNPGISSSCETVSGCQH